MDFTPGELIVFKVEPGIHYTQDGFVTVCARGKSLFLPEKINLTSYPSCSDFKGKLTEVACGDIGIVMNYLGRPWQINKDPEWFHYDVYSIYINGETCHGFKHNLRRINYRFNRLN